MFISKFETYLYLVYLHHNPEDPESKIFVEESSSDTTVLQRLPTKKWAKSSFFLINVAKSVGNPE